MWIRAYMLISVLFLMCTSHVYAEPVNDSLSGNEPRARKRFYTPDYFPLQYAGNIGLLSSGVGYQGRKDNYQLSVVYGFAPASVTGVNIHTVTGKNIFHLYKFPVHDKHTILPYAALGLSLELGGRSFFFQPDNMPSGYYDFPKSIHAIASAGLKFRYMTNDLKGFQGIEFFAEASTIDAYIWYKFLSRDVTMSQICSLALGVHLLRK